MTPTSCKSGNRCGHDPKNPRLDIENPPPANYPKILVQLARSDEIGKRIYQYFAAYTKNMFGRQMRSERREAVTIVVEAMCKRMDLASIQVGVPTPDGFYNYPFERIRAETGLGKSRFQRAIKDIKRCTGFNVKQLYKKDANGSHKGIAAVKKMSMRFFDAIGLGSQMRREQKRAKVRRLKKEREMLALQGRDARLRRYDAGFGRANSFQTVAESIQHLRNALGNLNHPPPHSHGQSTPLPAPSRQTGAPTRPLVPSSP